MTSNDGTYNVYNLDPDVSLTRINAPIRLPIEKEGNTGRVYQNGPVGVGVNTNFPSYLYSNVNDNLLVGAGIATYIDLMVSNLPMVTYW